MQRLKYLGKLFTELFFPFPDFSSEKKWAKCRNENKFEFCRFFGGHSVICNHTHPFVFSSLAFPVTFWVNKHEIRPGSDVCISFFLPKPALSGDGSHWLKRAQISMFLRLKQ